MWHRRETRRQTEKTKLNLKPWEKPAYSPDSHFWPDPPLIFPLTLVVTGRATFGLPGPTKRVAAASYEKRLIYYWDGFSRIDAFRPHVGSIGVENGVAAIKTRDDDDQPRQEPGCFPTRARIAEAGFRELA